jgi:3-oxoacyl-[acyl-carrier-protein] synthase II
VSATPNAGSIALFDRVVIRGIGLVTPLGVGVTPTWDRLLAGGYITTHARCPLPSPDDHRDRLDEARINSLAVAAATESLASTPGWTRATTADARTALVVATSRGPADEWADATAPPPVGPTSKNAAGRPCRSMEPSPSFGLSSIADSLARTLGHGFGPRLTLSAACASGLHALIRAAMLIEHGDADRAIVVAAESSLHPMFVESFRRLGVLAPDGERCRPFDVDRSGFLCAEAAAAVVLERATEPSTSPTAGGGGDANGIAGNADGTASDVWLDCYAFAGDASHLTGSDPSGATLRRLLAAAVDGRPVDVIHAHGTGTEANDAAEAAAIDAVLGAGLAAIPTSSAAAAATGPAVYSHKGAIGHTVGAAGLVSVVLNVLMHRHGVVPPNVGVRTPIALRRATIHRGAVQRPVRRSVALAAGFGGATAAVSLASSSA